MFGWLFNWWREKPEPLNFTPPVNTAPSFVVTKHFFDGEPSFWSYPSPKYWIAHSDLYPPAPPPQGLTFKRQKDDGTWEEYSVCNTHSAPFATNCYPISWESACAMNGGEPPETKQMASGDEMIVVTDFMRRNYRPRTDYNQTTLLF